MSEAQTIQMNEVEAIERCEQCSAPVEATQRYCVVCGHHRRQVRDPAAAYLMAAGARGRAPRPVAPTGVRRRGRSFGLATAVLIALIPLAVGLGVLVGRASNNGDAKLIAELRAQKPEIVTAGGGTTAAVSTQSAAPTSSFPLQDGYAVELQTVSASGATQASVSQIEQAARSKGASSVGLLSTSHYRVVPAPPSGSYVIYSGAYATQAGAQRALRKLKSKFPSAKVVQVHAVSASAANSAPVLATSAYGAAHQIAGSKVTAAQLTAGSQVVAHIQKTQGKSYVNAQRGLPDQIAIP